MKHWDEDKPRAYWASAARNGVRREWKSYRNRGARNANYLQALPGQAVTPDYDSVQLLQLLAAREPTALRTILNWVLFHAGSGDVANRVRVHRARQKLVRVRRSL